MPHQAPSPTVNLATQQSRYTRPLGSGYLHTLSGSFSNRPASALGRMSSFATAESSYSASYFLNVGNLRDTGHSAEAAPPAAMADEATKYDPIHTVRFCVLKAVLLRQTCLQMWSVACR